MATFYDNLRASRSNQSNRQDNTRNIIERGDMQKQRQAQTVVDPNAFFNFLRMVTLSPEKEKEKEQISLEEASPEFIDKPTQNHMYNEEEAYNINKGLAERGSLKIEDDLNKTNAANNGHLYASPPSGIDRAYGILFNYDSLNKVLDEYDALNTWNKKRDFVKEAYKKFEKNNDKYIDKWFDMLYQNTLAAQQYGETETRNVTDGLRSLNEDVKWALTRKS